MITSYRSSRIISVLLIFILFNVFNPIKAENNQSSEIRVEGTVTSAEDNEPLIGVTIMVKGSSTGTITDYDGVFTLSVPDENAVLIFRYVGFNTQEVTVGNRTNINVQLKPDYTQLEEFVVIGYGTVRKEDLTGSVVNVKMDDVVDVPVLSVDQALQGRVPGADIMSTTGEPGAPTSIRIRGTRSITAGNEPLIVVDGIADGVNDLSEINVADIESISVLKDASSTAIYGSRGSNGVIIVTTKSGAKGAPKISFKADLGVSDLPTELDLMNASEFAQYRNDFAYFATSDGYGEIGPETPMSEYPYPNPLAMGEGTNWVDEMTRTPLYQNYNFSISGGSDKTTYFGSLGFSGSQGIIEKSGMDRYTGRFNINHDLFDWLKVGYHVNHSTRNQDPNLVNIGGTSWWNSAIYLNPILRARSEVNDLWYSGQKFNSPRAILDNNISNNKFVNTTHSFNLELKPTDNILFKSQLSYYLYNRWQYRHQPSTLPAKNEGEGAYNYRSELNSVTYFSENTVTYNKTIEEKHKFDVMVGYTARAFNSENMAISGNGYQVDGLTWNNMGAIEDKENLSVSSYKEKNTQMSILGRVNYNYDRKYYLTATFRTDGASNFAKNKKFGHFPSAAFKWTVSNEDFFEDNKSVNEIALRLSAGRTGNSAIPNYRSLNDMGFSTGGYLFNGGQPLAAYPTRLASPNLTWENTDLYNIALDLSFFNNRLKVVAEAYTSYTKDLLLNVQTPIHTGYGSKLINEGKTSNKGLELLIDGYIIDEKDFMWNSTFSISHNTQMVEDVGTNRSITAYSSYGNNPYMVYGYVKGKPLNALWGFKYAGTWKTVEEVERNRITNAYISSSNAMYDVGNPRYLDTNNDGIFNEQDLVYLGNSDPWIYGGLQNNFTYKNWNIGIFFHYSLGGKIYNLSEQWLGSGANTTNQYRFMLNSWHPIRNPNSDIPRAGANETVLSDRNVYDASYLRFKNLSLGYNFDLRERTNNVIKNLYLSLNAENLFVLKDYNGFDPDVSSSSGNSTLRRVDLGAYPKQRTLVFSVQIQY